MADANIKINVQSASLEQLNAEMARLQTEIKGVAVNSKEFKKLSADIRSVDSAIESTNRKLKSLDVGAVVGDLAKLGGGVAAATQLFKQFGSEGSQSNEDIQKALETTNTIIGASAIAEGVASAAKLAGVAATKLATGAQAAYAAVVGTSTGALRAFKLALAATGIGVIVVLIGELIANWDKLTSTVKSSSQTIEEFGKNLESTLISVDGLLSEAEFKIQEKLAKGFSLNDVLEENKKAINDYVERLKGKAQEASANFIIASREAFDYEQSLRDKGLSEEEIAANETLKTKKETADKAEKISDDLDSKIRTKQLQTLKLDKDAANERLQILEQNAKKEQLLAKDNELKLIQIDKDLQLKKLNEIKAAGTFTQLEIDNQQLAYETTLNNESKYFEKVQQQKLDAEREYYNTRASLLEVTYEERLNTLDRNYSAELKGLQKKGLSEAEIASQTQTLNLKYSIERIKVVQEEEKKKLDLVKESITTRLELEKKAAESLGDFTKVAQIQAAIEQIRTDADAAAQNADIEARKRLSELLKLGKITEDAYKQALTDLGKLNTEFKTEVGTSAGEGGSAIISTAIDSAVSTYESTLEDFISEIDIANSKAEAKAIKATTGNKDKAAVKQAQQELLQTQIENRKRAAEATILATNDEIKALQALTNLSEEEEDKRQKRILELRKKGAKASVDLATASGQAIENTTKSATDKAIENLTKFAKATQAAVDLLNTINQAVQAQDAIEQANFEARQARLQKEYGGRFKAIDDETKKLDEQENKKKKYATVEERRRAQLAEQRAQLEEQQAIDLAKIQEEQARAQAENQIDQANIQFALGVGSIIVSTAQAIAESIALSPATFGQPWASINAGLGAIQIGAAYAARSAAISQANASLAGLGGDSGGQKSKRLSRASGGIIYGPGTETSDSIPTNLSKGEFVVNAKATRQYLPLLEQINRTGINSSINTSGMANGGFIDALSVISPSFGIANLTERVDVIESKINQPMKAYVVATDIETVKNKENYISRRANIL
jgi:hypothetical protein